MDSREWAWNVVQKIPNYVHQLLCLPIDKDSSLFAEQNPMKNCHVTIILNFSVLQYKFSAVYFVVRTSMVSKVMSQIIIFLNWLVFPMNTTIKEIVRSVKDEYLKSCQLYLFVQRVKFLSEIPPLRNCWYQVLLLMVMNKFSLANGKY